MLPVYFHDDPNKEYTAEQECDKIIRRMFDRESMRDRDLNRAKRLNHLSAGCQFFAGLFIMISLAAGCAHYPVNETLREYDPNAGYRGKLMRVPGKSDNMLMFVTFSGGGTRAAALSYGVLEELAKTEVVIDGKKRRLLDEVDVMSSVSGGSFTAAYYGLFGDRIFQDFE